tara:strand:+ start:1414 stop:1521 length:108 start_codon:yes stop_codon:yes gene_type:complete
MILPKDLVLIVYCKDGLILPFLFELGRLEGFATNG